MDASINEFLLYLAIGLAFYLLSLRFGKLLKKYKEEYRQIASIEPDNSLGFNLVYRSVFIPVLLIIVVVIFYCIGWEEYSNDLWIVSIIVVAMQVFTIAVIGRLPLLNKGLYFIVSLFSVVLSLTVSKYIAPMGLEAILPDARSISVEIVAAITVFIYGVAKEIKEDEEKHTLRVNRYINKREVFLKRKHKKALSRYDAQMQSILLAIMVYEDYNRPKVVRVVEKMLRAKTSDVMQVEKSLNDNEGIRKTANKIVYTYGKGAYSKKTVLSIFASHNPGSPNYSSNVYEIYTRLRNGQ